jgi:hypothetical protein
MVFKHKKGWKEAFKAVGYGLAVIVILSFVATCVGCAGMSAGVKYTHHSSIPEYYDINESNMVGPYLRVPTCGWERNYSPWCPEVEFSAQWDLRDNRPFGTNPVGTINITQPIWIK